MPRGRFLLGLNFGELVVGIDWYSCGCGKVAALFGGAFGPCGVAFSVAFGSGSRQGISVSGCFCSSLPRDPVAVISCGSSHTSGGPSLGRVVFLGSSGSISGVCPGTFALAPPRHRAQVILRGPFPVHPAPSVCTTGPVLGKSHRTPVSSSGYRACCERSPHLQYSPICVLTAYPP